MLPHAGGRAPSPQMAPLFLLEKNCLPQADNNAPDVTSDAFLGLSAVISHDDADKTGRQDNNTLDQQVRTLMIIPYPLVLT